MINALVRNALKRVGISLEDLVTAVEMANIASQLMNLVEESDNPEDEAVDEEEDTEGAEAVKAKIEAFLGITALATEMELARQNDEELEESQKEIKERLSAIEKDLKIS